MIFMFRSVAPEKTSYYSMAPVPPRTAARRQRRRTLRRWSLQAPGRLLQYCSRRRVAGARPACIACADAWYGTSTTQPPTRELRWNGPALYLQHTRHTVLIAI